MLWSSSRLIADASVQNKWRNHFLFLYLAEDPQTIAIKTERESEPLSPHQASFAFILKNKQFRVSVSRRAGFELYI